MKQKLNVTLIALLLTTLLFSGSCQRKYSDSIKKLYVSDDLGVYVEAILPSDTASNRYTVDNKAYKPGRKYVFDYFILSGRDTLKIQTPRFVKPEDDYQRIWEFIPTHEKHPDKIETISITVLPGLTNVNQTKLKYEYQYSTENSGFLSTSGVIENEMNTWMHPHRDKYFMILELNPFPFIQQPFEVGNKWTWELTVGDHWQDQRWKLWTGSLDITYRYEIIGRVKSSFKMGAIDCWVIKSKATSSIGSTELIAYYNEELGFVKFNYTNIDKSKLIIDIRSIVN